MPGRWFFNFHTPLGFPETHRDFYPEFYLFGVSFFFFPGHSGAYGYNLQPRLSAEMWNTQVSIAVQWRRPPRKFVSRKRQPYVESGDFNFIEKWRSQRKTFSGEMSRLFLIKLSTPPLSVYCPPPPSVFHTEPPLMLCNYCAPIIFYCIISKKQGSLAPGVIRKQTFGGIRFMASVSFMGGC